LSTIILTILETTFCDLNIAAVSFTDCVSSSTMQVCSYTLILLFGVSLHVFQAYLVSSLLYTDATRVFPRGRVRKFAHKLMYKSFKTIFTTLQYSGQTNDYF
jgi:hypothetical protein